MDYEHRAFSYNYVQNQWNEDTLLSYIADPEGYAQKRAENHIAENQENMLYACLYHDAVWKEYRAVLSDTKNTVHLIKKISAAITATSAKTFKMEASDLRRDCGACYSTQSIVAADHRKFVYLLCLPVRTHTIFATK